MNRYGGVVMTAEILEQANSLAAAIAKSPELANLRKSEEEMLANDEAQQIIGEFQEAQSRLSQLYAEGKEPTEADNQLMESIEKKVGENPLIAAYLQTQDQFTQMLESINSIIAGAIAGPDQNGGCNSGACGPSCGCGGCQ